MDTINGRSRIKRRNTNEKEKKSQTNSNGGLRKKVWKDTQQSQIGPQKSKLCRKMQRTYSTKKNSPTEKLGT